LAHDADDIDAPDEVGEEADASDETEPPEDFRDGGDLRSFGDDPLDEHASKEGGLSEEPDHDPPEGAPGGDVEEAKEVAFNGWTGVPFFDLKGNERVEFHGVVDFGGSQWFGGDDGVLELAIVGFSAVEHDLDGADGDGQVCF